MRRSVLLLCVAAAALRAEVPGWVKEFAGSAHPTYPGKTKAVVLFREERVVASETGMQTTQIRKVIKILTADGKREAVGAITLDQKGAKLRDARAYLVYPGGKTREYARKEFSEGEANSGLYLYSTRKYVAINAADAVDPGTVFAYEFALEEKRVFSQFSFDLQDDLPHLLTRFQLVAPAGWQVESKEYNGNLAKHETDGSTHTWEARNLPPFELEPSAPSMYAQLPRVDISMLSPGGAVTHADAPVACFKSWRDVSIWKYALADPQAEVTPAIEAKAAELTAGATDMLDKVRRIGEFAQKIRYVAISTNSARGGGYVPHKADEVLKAAYGDCKDKANLMRTLLKSVGVVSWPVAIFSGDPRFTQQDFPSPHQFNHAILAIAVPAGTKSPAAFDDPELGRLLLFDPTDPHVPFGFLPDHEQNAWALVTANDRGKLVRTPQAAPAENRVERRWKMSLAEDGSVTGEMDEITTGQEAFDERARGEALNQSDYRKALEAWITRSVPGAVLTQLSYQYVAEQQQFRTNIGFTAPAYAKIMRGKLWMVRSAPVAFQGPPNTNRSDRSQPLVVKALYLDEEVAWTFPAKLKVDELPESDRVTVPAGSFSTEWKTNGAAIRVERKLQLENTVVPATDYGKTREFLARFRGAENAPIVLMAP